MAGLCYRAVTHDGMRGGGRPGCPCCWRPGGAGVGREGTAGAGRPPAGTGGGARDMEDGGRPPPRPPRCTPGEGGPRFMLHRSLLN